MTCRSVVLFLLILISAGGAVAQVLPELEPYGLDTSDPGKLREVITRLERGQQVAAVEALRILVADTSLVTRARDNFVARRRAVGGEVNLDHEHRRAVAEVARVRDAARRAARRLGFMRDTNIYCAFDLPDSALSMLAKQGAVVMTWTKNEMYEWYDENFPFVTTDLVYHTFMILVRAAIDELENLSFNEELTALAQEWAASCLELAESLGADDAEMSRDNAALLAVAVVLAADGETTLIDRFGLDAVRRSHVEAEVARVREAGYFGASPLLGEDEDYTEYRVRGRASGNRGVGYVRARHWLSRAVYPVDSTRATRRALLLTEALARRPESWRRWERLDGMTTRLSGPRDDPDVRMYRELAEDISGRRGPTALRTVLEDGESFDQFSRRCRLWSEPVIDDSPARGRRAILGLRVLAQRRSADGVLLQRVAEEEPWPISGLQVMAGLFDIPGEGSLLKQAGLKLPPSASTVAIDSVGLMSGYRNCHEVLFAVPEGLPQLFRSGAWRDKQVNASLGAWAESRHAAAPYLKSAHIYMGISAIDPQLQGYVEPYPRFYRRLKAEARRWDDLCRDVGVYEAVAGRIEADPKAHRLDDGRFPEFMEILDRLAEMAEGELGSEPQKDSEAKFLKKLGTRLRHLCFNHSSMNISEEPMSRVIDVATEYQSGEVLEVGVGQAHAIFVAVPHGDETVVCRGSVYGYHELVVPLQNRLDDSVWESISAGTVIMGQGPWLDRSSPLYYRPCTSAPDLQSYAESPPGHTGGRRGPPWDTEIQNHRPVPPWVGLRLCGADAAQLISMAEREDLQPDLLRFATRELSRHGGRDEVLGYWRRTVDGIITQGALRGYYENDALRLFWALQGLAMHGNADDLARLDAVGTILGKEYRVNQGSVPRAPALRWLLQVAVANCGSGGNLQR